MKIFKMKDYDAMSCKAASIISAQIILEPSCVLGLATGSTPIGAYSYLTKWNKLDFSEVRTFNLDEYVGLSPSNDQSYRYFMEQNLFSNVNIKPENINIPNGVADDLDAECMRYEALITQLGGVDLQLLGIGHNGHIGFCEPGDSFEKVTHKVALTQSTIDANKRFFADEKEVPRFALTMGIGTILCAKRIVMVVSGKEKSNIIKSAFTGPITPKVPASILQLHPNFMLVGDEDALSLLQT